MEYNNLNKIYKTDFLDLYHCDCMELLRQTPDNYYSLALVYPPYGINFDGNTTVKGKADKEYYEQAKKRLYNHQRQLTIF